MFKRAHVAFFCLVAFGIVIASGQHYTFKQYGQEQGLGNLDIMTLAQDRAGYLWMGTENGVYRYDGSNFRQYGLEQGLTELYDLNVYIDPQDVVWVGTETGVFYLDQGRFHELTANGHSLEQTTSSSLLSLPSGETLIGTRSNGLYSARRTRDAWAVEPFSTRHTEFDQSLKPNALFLEGKDRLWVGCGLKICEVSSTHVLTFGPKEGVPSDTYISIAHDGTGSLWARGTTHMLRLSQGADRFRDYPEVCRGKECDSAPARFGQDRDQRLITPLRSGLSRWDGLRWERIGQAQGLPPSLITQAFADRDGIVWLAAPGYGLWKWLGYGEWEHWSTAEKLIDPDVFGILRDHRGRLWVASDKEVMRSDPLNKKFERFVTADGHSLHGVQSVVGAHDGTLWLVSRAGDLWHLWPESGRMEHSLLPSGSYDALCDSRDRIWIATNRGLFAEEKIGNKWKLQEQQPSLFHVRLVRTVAEGPDHTMWAGSVDGLFHETGGVWKRVPIQELALRNKVTNVAVAPDGTVWMSGQFMGVAHLHIERDAVTSVEILRPNPEQSDLIWSIDIDRFNRIWLGTDHGLDMLEAGNWRHYNIGEGMISNDTNEKATFIDDDGSFWLGTPLGLSHLMHPERRWNAGPLASTLTGASWAGLPLSLEGQKRLPWRSGDLTVNFAVLSFRNEDAIRFRYRLVGLEEDWVSTRERSARYAKLPPGYYRFEVVSEDTSLHQRSRPASFSFEIAPPWWRTWEFFLFIAVLLAAILMAVWRRRTRQLIAAKQRLEVVVAERTHALEEERLHLLLLRDAFEQQATHDALTGLMNRRAIFEALTREWQRACREHLTLLVVIADLDHFKLINDTYGHPAGDQVLIQAAKCLATNFREYDALGRYGGEEFLFVLIGCKVGHWGGRLEHIRESLARQPLKVGDTTIPITCSFGAAGFFQDEDRVSVEDLLAAADRALYRAKANGRDRVEFAESLSAVEN